MRGIRLLLFIFLATIFIIGLEGCSSKMNCLVYGKPGTEVYDSKNQWLGTIDNDGKTKIVLNRKERHDFVYTKEGKDTPIMPIGLNYDKRNNTFRDIMAGVTCFPTIYISAAAWNNYHKNADVEDGLKLHKRQNTNEDLMLMVNSSTNPYDEIRSLNVKSHKFGRLRNEEKNKIETKTNDLEWINTDGEVKEIKSFGIEVNNQSKSQSFKGNIVFDFSTDPKNPVIKIKGKLKNGKIFSHNIELNKLFKKSGSKYFATEKHEKTSVEITPLDNGNAMLTFELNETPVKIMFNPKSFVAKEKGNDLKNLFD
ncbi:MAG: hypothetical protein NC102_02990 [Clostridium sp.]|nr:hypothetical protein [Clostridium sp.]